MPVHDDGLHRVVPLAAHSLGIELVGRVCLEMDAHSPLFEERFGSRKVIAHGHFFQDFQPILRLAAHSPQGSRNRQPDHAGAGNAHSHAVLINISAHEHVNLLGNAAQFFLTTGTRQSACHRFGASQRGDSFHFQYFNDLLFCCLTHDGIQF